MTIEKIQSKLGYAATVLTSGGNGWVIAQLAETVRANPDTPGGEMLARMRNARSHIDTLQRMLNDLICLAIGIQDQQIVGEVMEMQVKHVCRNMCLVPGGLRYEDGIEAIDDCARAFLKLVGVDK